LLTEQDFNWHGALHVHPIQTNISMHHYGCVVLCEASILQKGRFWVASLASSSSMSNEVRSSLMFLSQSTLYVHPQQLMRLFEEEEGSFRCTVCIDISLFVYSLFAGTGPAYSGPQRWDHIAVQCTCPGRGRELVGVIIIIIIIIIKCSLVPYLQRKTGPIRHYRSTHA